MRSLNITSPTLSLFRTADSASTHASSAASSRLVVAPDPKSPDAETSTNIQTTSSRSS